MNRTSRPFIRLPVLATIVVGSRGTIPKLPAVRGSNLVTPRHQARVSASLLPLLRLTPPNVTFAARNKTLDPWWTHPVTQTSQLGPPKEASRNPHRVSVDRHDAVELYSHAASAHRPEEV
jgi:hypothetical protein